MRPLGNEVKARGKVTPQVDRTEESASAGLMVKSSLWVNPCESPCGEDVEKSQFLKDIQEVSKNVLKTLSIGSRTKNHKLGSRKSNLGKQTVTLSEIIMEVDNGMPSSMFVGVQKSCLVTNYGKDLSLQSMPISF